MNKIHIDTKQSLVAMIKRETNARDKLYERCTFANGVVCNPLTKKIMQE